MMTSSGTRSVALLLICIFVGTVIVNCASPHVCANSSESINEKVSDPKEIGLILVKGKSNLENIAKEISSERGWIFLSVDNANPIKIKSAIKEAIADKNVGYLLILGDNDEIPIEDEENLIPNRLKPIDWGGEYIPAPLDLLFYGNIDNDDFVELAVGRLPFGTEEEVRRYFENLEVKGKSVNTIVYPALGPLSPGDVEGCLKEYENINIYIDSPGGELIDLLLDAKIFAAFSHGSPEGFGSLWFDEVPDMWSNRPIVLVSACSTAKRIGKVFMKKGASAYMGFYEWAVPDSTPLPIFGEDSLGRSYQKHVNSWIASSSIRCTFILYGDPTLAVPSLPKAENVIEIYRKNGKITLRIPPFTTVPNLRPEPDLLISALTQVTMSTFLPSEIEGIENGRYMRDNAPLPNVILEVDVDVVEKENLWRIQDAVRERSPYEYGRIFSDEPVFYYVFQVENFGYIAEVYVKIDNQKFTLNSCSVAKGDTEEFITVGITYKNLFDLIREEAFSKPHKITVLYSSLPKFELSPLGVYPQKSMWVPGEEVQIYVKVANPSYTGGSVVVDGTLIVNGGAIETQTKEQFIGGGAEYVFTWTFHLPYSERGVISFKAELENQERSLEIGMIKSGSTVPRGPSISLNLIFSLTLIAWVVGMLAVYLKGRHKS